MGPEGAEIVAYFKDLGEAEAAVLHKESLDVLLFLPGGALVCELG